MRTQAPEAGQQRGKYLLLALVFAACTGTAIVWTDPWTSTAVIVIFGWAIWTYYRVEPLFLYLALPFVFHWAWCLVSIRYLERGAYISEQFQFGTLTGASARFSLLALTFLSVVMLCVSRFARSPRLSAPHWSAGRGDRSRSFVRMALLFAWSLVGALLMTGLVFGFPLLTGQTRFGYWPSTPGLERLAYLVPVAALTLGVAQHMSSGKRSWVALLAGISSLLLFSDKFSGPLTAIIYFAMGYYAARALDPATVKRHVGLGRAALVAPLVAALLVGTTLYGYTVVDGKQSYELRDAVVDRALGLQGHVYYGVDRRVVVDESDTVDPGEFFAPNREPLQPAGLVRLMHEISPSSFVYAMRAAGIRFTNGYPAIAVASFGFLGALGVQIAAGLLFALFAYYVALKIARLDFAGLVLAGAYLSNIVTNALLMGEVYYVYRPLGLVLLAAMVLEHLNSNALMARRSGHSLRRSSSPRNSTSAA